MANNQPRAIRDFFIPGDYDVPPGIAPPDVGDATFEIKPHFLQMLPIFYGLNNENPYHHLNEFLEVCSTFRVRGIDHDALKLRIFPFSLKDKAKYWLHSLQAGEITTWAQLKSKFLERYFPMAKTTSIRKAITNFSQQDNEALHENWERFNDLLRSCPHHDVPKWQLVEAFYHGLSERNQQMVDASCGGMFLYKNENEAWEVFERLSENSQQHASFARSGEHRGVKKGIYEIAPNHDLALRVDAITRKLDQLLATQKEPVHAVGVNLGKQCALCDSPTHALINCPMASQFPEFVQEHVNAAQGQA